MITVAQNRDCDSTTEQRPLGQYYELDENAKSHYMLLHIQHDRSTVFMTNSNDLFEMLVKGRIYSPTLRQP